MNNLKDKLKKYNWELISIMVVYLLAVLVVLKLDLEVFALKTMFILIIIGVIITTWEQSKQNYNDKN